MSINVIGVVGAGVIGTGVAQSLAQSGRQVLLLDTAAEALARARQEVANNIRFRGLWQKGEGKENAAQVLQRITFATDYSCLQAADFVIENVTEKWAVKKDVYEQLDRVCPPHCIFAANTSAITITRIAAATRRPGQVIGVHFMNPVPLKPVVEVIRGHHTTEETIRRTHELLEAMGKSAIVVNDSPGFVSNRVLMLTINEAIFLLQEQVATAEDIDRIFKTCFGHKMGPLETADLIGLDTILFSIEVLYESFNDSKYRPCPLLRKMVDAGLYGRKNGQGFYAY
jgi:3-hydroxybutyryl-CoA dehydrogenase